MTELNPRPTADCICVMKRALPSPAPRRDEHKSSPDRGVVISVHRHVLNVLLRPSTPSTQKEDLQMPGTAMHVSATEQLDFIGKVIITPCWRPRACSFHCVLVDPVEFRSTEWQSQSPFRPCQTSRQSLSLRLQPLPWRRACMMRCMSLRHPRRNRRPTCLQRRRQTVANSSTAGEDSCIRHRGACAALGQTLARR